MPGAALWGKCPKCKKPLRSVMERGLCTACQKVETLAKVERMREDPDLRELEKDLEPITDLFP